VHPRLSGGPALFPSRYDASPRDTTAIAVGSAIRFLAPLHLPCIYYDFFLPPLPHPATQARCRGPPRLVRGPFSLVNVSCSKALRARRPIKTTSDDVSIHTHTQARAHGGPRPRFTLPRSLLFSSHPTCALIDPKWPLVEARSFSLVRSLARSS